MTGAPELLLPAVAAGLVLALGAAVLAAAATARGVPVRSRVRGGPVAGPPPWFASVIAALEIPITPAAAWPWAARGAAGASVVLAVRAPAVLLALVALAIAVRAGARTRSRRASARQLDRQLPALIDDVVAAMASGASLLQGLTVAAERAGTQGTHLRRALHLSAQGLGLQAALDGWAEQQASSGIGLLADALALAGATGGSQVGALRSVGDTLREREALQREVEALAAQARLSATVLVFTPAAFAAVVALLDRRIAAFLFASPLGWACLVGGIALDSAGAWWMRRLVGAVA